MRRLLIIVLLLGACTDPGPSLVGFEVREIAVDDASLTVYVAETSQQRRQGLQEVEELRAVDGMLFTWPDSTSASFNMENTYIPLDIWWFDADGVLVGSTTMQPCEDDDCLSYRSPGEVLWALETAAGVFEFAPGATISTVENG